MRGCVQADDKFKAWLGYDVNSRPACAILALSQNFEDNTKKAGDAFSSVIRPLPHMCQALVSYHKKIKTQFIWKIENIRGEEKPKGFYEYSNLIAL